MIQIDGGDCRSGQASTAGSGARRINSDKMLVSRMIMTDGFETHGQPSPGPCAKEPGGARDAGYTDLMRLTDTERHHISEAATAVLPAGSRVCLFGSRVDDAKRGGDVDLLVEVPAARAADELMRLRSLLTVQLYRRLGERRIDIVMIDPDAGDDRLIVAEARRQAVELVRT